LLQKNLDKRRKILNDKDAEKIIKSCSNDSDVEKAFDLKTRKAGKKRTIKQEAKVEKKSLGTLKALTRSQKDLSTLKGKVDQSEATSFTEMSDNAKVQNENEHMEE
jgi:divalent metal cation (Fe/Co/Zn/Cd) transporter